MRQREISALQVDKTLTSPDRTYLGPQGKMIAEKAFGPGATVRVVFVDRLDAQGKRIHVVTVMWK